MAKFALSLIVLFALLGALSYSSNFDVSMLLANHQTHNLVGSCHPRCRSRVPKSKTAQLYGAHGQRLSPVVVTRNLDTDEVISYDAVVVLTGYKGDLPAHTARLDEVVGCYAGRPLSKGQIIDQYSIYPLPSEVESRLVCTERAIPKGAIIDATDVSPEKTTMEFGPDMLTNCSQAIGRQALKDLPSGSLLRTDDVTNQSAK